jgi:hypothetical protein
MNKGANFVGEQCKFSHYQLLVALRRETLSGR